MTFSAHVSGKQPMKRGLLPANTIPWCCDCLTADLDSNSRVLVCKLNPGYLKRCIDCRVSRP